MSEIMMRRVRRRWDDEEAMATRNGLINEVTLRGLNMWT